MKGLLLFCLFACSAFGCKSVLERGYDAGESGAMTSERTITTANVSKLIAYPSYVVDDLVFSTPLVYCAADSGLSYDMLVITTMNGTLYAFDANAPGSTAKYTLNLGTPVPCTAGYSWSTQCPNLFRPHVPANGHIGCLPTGVIDGPNGYFYNVCSNYVASPQSLNWALLKVNLKTGSITSQVNLAGSVGGGCPQTFTPGHHWFRSGLQISADGSKVYIAINGNEKLGWVMTYATSNLAQTNIFCTAPCHGTDTSYDGGSPWMGGGHITRDSAGNVYTGNATGGCTEYGMAAAQFDSSGNFLAMNQDPSCAAHFAIDAEWGSSSIRIAPWNSNRILTCSKDYSCVYADWTNSMATVQLWYNTGTASGSTGYYNTIALWNNAIYIGGVNQSLLRLAYNSGSDQFTTTATGLIGNGTCNEPFPGMMPMITANGTSNGILWTVHHHSGSPLTEDNTFGIAAYDANLVTTNPTPLWVSVGATTSCPTTTGSHYLSKFNVPVSAANGFIYYATFGDGSTNYYVDVWGLPNFGQGSRSAVSGGVMGGGGIQ